MTELNIIARSDPHTHDVVVKLVEKYLNKDKKILDVGCGTGAFLFRIKDLVENRFGCDFNVGQYKEELNKNNIVKVDLDWEKLPYSTEEFDVVFCLDVLEHLFNPYALASECLRILKKDGILVVSTPNVHSYIQRLFFLLTGEIKGFWDKNHNRKLGERHITPIFKHELLEFLEDRGRIVEEDFNRSNIPKLGVELRKKSLFLSETSVWIIQKM